MNIEMAAELGRAALFLTVLLALPAMLSGLCVGLLVSLLQALTSIQEQTLAFVPKILVTLAVTLVALPWVMQHLIEYTIELYRTIPTRF